MDQIILKVKDYLLSLQTEEYTRDELINKLSSEFNELERISICKRVPHAYTLYINNEIAFDFLARTSLDDKTKLYDFNLI